MDNIIIDDEYQSNWDASMLFPFEELNSYFEEEASFGYYDDSTSSPDGAHDQSTASNNIVSERNRRDKLKQRLYALRSVVPNITKLDKASIVKDAIGYIESLHAEERKIQAEIAEMESSSSSISNTGLFYSDQDNQHHHFSATAVEHYYHSSAVPFVTPPPSHPVQLLELRVSSMGERIIVVSLTCSNTTDTMMKLCHIFESLNLSIITANINVLSGRILKTVFLQGDEEEKEVLSSKIRAAMAALNDSDIPMAMPI